MGKVIKDFFINNGNICVYIYILNRRDSYLLTKAAIIYLSQCLNI